MLEIFELANFTPTIECCPFLPAYVESEFSISQPALYVCLKIIVVKYIYIMI